MEKSNIYGGNTPPEVKEVVHIWPISTRHIRITKHSNYIYEKAHSPRYAYLLRGAHPNIPFKIRGPKTSDAIRTYCNKMKQQQCHSYSPLKVGEGKKDNRCSLSAHRLHDQNNFATTSSPKQHSPRWWMSSSWERKRPQTFRFRCTRNSPHWLWCTPAWHYLLSVLVRRSLEQGSRRQTGRTKRPSRSRAWTSSLCTRLASMAVGTRNLRPFSCRGGIWNFVDQPSW